MKKHFCYLAGILSLIALPVKADNINISADKTVEIHQNEQKLVATGNAVASKKDNTIYADEMTAYYIKTPQGKTTFTTVNAKGNVRAVSPTTTATGNTMVYNLTEEEITLRGTPAKIINNQKDTITAEDEIVYYPEKQIAIATGNVIATSKDNTVYSDKMISHFTKDTEGNLNMDKVEIYDHVKIITPQATATSDRGTYFPQKGMVTLFDNVIINQDGNILKGDYAETNLNTGISRMLSKNTHTRVSGVFKEKENKENKPTEEKTNHAQ